MEALCSRGVFLLTGLNSQVKSSRISEPVYTLNSDGELHKSHEDHDDGVKMMKYKSESAATTQYCWGIDFTYKNATEIFSSFDCNIGDTGSEFVVISETISRYRTKNYLD